MESAKDHAFTPPPRAWIVDRVQKLNQLLVKRTEPGLPRRARVGVSRREST